MLQFTKRLIALIATFILGIAVCFVVFSFAPKPERVETVVYDVEIFKPIEIGNATCVLPNPFYLEVNLDDEQNIKLNRQKFGNLSDTTNLKSTLRETFELRDKFNGFNPKTKKIEKTIILLASPNLKSSDVLKIISDLKETGANPIQLNIDNCHYTVNGKCHW